MNCLINAWRHHESELRVWLGSRLKNPYDSEDILQNVFLKALTQGNKFCEIGNVRAWLFEVARNAIADHLRLKKEQVELPEDLVHDSEEPVAVDNLTACIPGVLSGLSREDQDAITLCDLEGMKQEDYAQLRGISLPGAKSRAQRARKRLREHLINVCRVRFDETGKVCCFVGCPTSNNE